MNIPTWQALLNAGIQAVRQQNPQTAIRQLEQAYQLQAADPQVRYWLANAYRISGDFVQAEQLLNGLLDQDSANTDAAFAKAFLLRDLGRTRHAAETLTGLAGSRPNDLDKLLKAAGLLANDPFALELLTEAEAGVRLDPNDLNHVLPIKARTEAMAGLYENFLRQNPRTPLAPYALRRLGTVLEAPPHGIVANWRFEEDGGTHAASRHGERSGRLAGHASWALGRLGGGHRFSLWRL